MKVFPESWLRLMKPEDRKALGQMSAAEAQDKFLVRSEKELQRLVLSFLHLKGIEANVSAMHRKTTHTIGWPDITFAVDDPNVGGNACACAWECKMPGRFLDPAQSDMFKRLTTYPNKWRYRVIRSVGEAKAELEAMGIV